MAKARILLVEDDPDVRPLLEHILITELYSATTADSVAVALSLLARQPFDLVVCDVNLPDGSGLRIADEATTAGVKALVVTGHGLSLKPGDLAPYDYLLKPLRVSELVAAIERALAEKDDGRKSFDFRPPLRANGPPVEGNHGGAREAEASRADHPRPG